MQHRLIGVKTHVETAPLCGGVVKCICNQAVCIERQLGIAVQE